MGAAPAQSVPALLRSGDIGVATEWRSLVLDWAALLTELGTDIYTYLRDDYDQQRTLWPFLVPQGPTKRKVQTKLGRKSAVSLYGPEYLLEVVGLVAISYRRGAHDPEHPNRTHVAYYSVGKLDYPQLDWPMLSQVFDALMDALDPAAPNQRAAQQALRALSRSGLFQPGDPADVFYDFGAWPALLPQVLTDARWEALFSYLHGPAALAPYRAAARAWCAAVARTMQRRAARNQAILDAIQTMQQDPSSGPLTPPAAADPSTSLPLVPGTASPASAQAGDLRSSASVPAESPQSPQAGDPGSAPSGTPRRRSQPDASSAGSMRVPDESPARESYTGINRGGWEERDSANTADRDSDVLDVRDIGGVPAPGDTGTCQQVVFEEDISRYLRDEELASCCLDAAFWCAVNQILHGSATRYPHTAGERKALQRQFQRPGVPTGVVLAALRAVMDRSAPPTTLAAALVHPAFQAAVAEARRLVPAAASEDAWSHFLWRYRTVGSTTVRQVSPAEHRALQQLFGQQPDACWAVLERIAQMATPPPRLTPRYLAQAVENNLQAALERDLQPSAHPMCAPGTIGTPARAVANAAVPAAWSADEAAQLAALGLRPGDLQPFAPALVRAWLAAYQQRHTAISHPRHWLLWGLRSAVPPEAHPDLRRHPAQTAATALGPPQGADPPTQAGRSDGLWARVLDQLRPQVPPGEFTTWLEPTALLDLDEQRAVIAVGHVFAHDTLQRQYAAVLSTALQAIVGQPVAIEIVIDAHVGGWSRS